MADVCVSDDSLSPVLSTPTVNCTERRSCSHNTALLNFIKMSLATGSFIFRYSPTPSFTRSGAWKEFLMELFSVEKRISRVRSTQFKQSDLINDSILPHYRDLFVVFFMLYIQ